MTNFGVVTAAGQQGPHDRDADHALGYRADRSALLIPGSVRSLPYPIIHFFDCNDDNNKLDSLIRRI
jgi:hypothetical protein